MKLFLPILLFLCCCMACKKEYTTSANRFKQGVFEIPGGKGYSKTIITRKDSLQIEEYTRTIDVSTDNGIVQKKVTYIDTLYITWRNEFAYYLQMKSPKTDLDEDPIFVQINKIKDSSYTFTAKIGYSNFKQKGTLFISK